jgi:2'-hydroxyisoflavone reductase
VTGTFNASGPTAPVRPTALDFFEACCGLGDAPARPVWADEAWLLEESVQPWMELPLWVTSGLPAHATRSIARAVEAGLGFRSVEETLRDTLGWALRERGERPWAAGLDPDREAGLLERWRARG